ncbi:polymer-forming cytoskeletal protein [Paenibacillus sp. CECT 9249]|uniref:bactofilin family protein n=1 Tax=unclassified Paenibacillus TaxID=185978 RepID=UPI001C12115D|nr:polymer-forming cytoskeletal protein [Paenibacillus sp. CECT 9249]MBU5442180.1 polymer-forming cytoskeletal protein [Paenibacillus sp. MSJ-34]CAH0118925.1 hypothetical protein PAE9249_01422 [Paenibacillus sp. CECT 9249]
MFKSSKPQAQQTDTLIGYGTQIEGKIVCETNLRIEGNFTGEIECARDVTIGENGSAHSNISAADIVIAGLVHGNIHAKGKLTITPTGRLHGNFTSASVIIHEGALFVGESKMSAPGGEADAAGKAQKQAAAAREE